MSQHAIENIEDLEALPDGAFLRASGRNAVIQSWSAAIPVKTANTAHFEDCTIRPVPREWSGGRRVFELLTYGASRADGFCVTNADLIALPAIVLWLPEGGAA